LLRAHAGMALLLTGCAHFDPAPISSDKSAEKLETRSLSDPDLTTFVAKHSTESKPGNRWNFEKLTLAAFYYSPELEVARAQWAVARGGETTASQRPNPTLTFTPGYDSSPSSLSPWFPLWMLDVPLETAGKRKHRQAHSAHLSEVARLNVATVAWQVRSNVRTGLLQLSGALKHEQGVQRTLELYEEILKALREQEKLGAISKSDLTVYDIARQKARLDVADAARQKSEARAKLAEAIGIPLRALDGVTLETPEAAVNEQLTSSEARRSALLGRADVLGGLAEYAAAESALRLEIAKQYPDVHLQPGYQFDQGDNKWSVGLVMELPVLSHNQGPILEAKAKRQVAAARFAALQSKVMTEIDKAEEALKVGQNNFAAFGELKRAQQRQLASAEAQYKAGEVEKLDWYKARIDAATTELAVIDAEAKVQQAIGGLEDAIQRPLDYFDIVYAGPNSAEKPRSHTEH
jgi:cobalt-zinc-cadmium efflux system outer membrane protein